MSQVRQLKDILKALLAQNKEDNFTVVILHHDALKSVIQICTGAGFMMAKQYTICSMPTGR